MASPQEEEALLRSVAIQNAASILAARQRAEAALHAMLEATTDGILAVDEERRVVHFNRNYLVTWGLAGTALEARHHSELIERVSALFHDPAGFRARIEEVYAASPPESYDLLELADGRTIERWSKAQHTREGSVGRVWIFRDITERRRAELALREETRLLELINRTGTSLATNLDLETLVQTITDAATQLSGAQFGAFFYNTGAGRGGAYKLYALSGAPREAFERFGMPRATPLFGPTFRGEGVVRLGDVLEDPRYGTMAPHHGMPKGHLPVRSYLAVPVTSRSGEVIGGLFFGHSAPGMFSERAERIIVAIAAQAAVAIDNARLLERERAARAEAERMSEIKDEFLATLSHELRTPLSAILGWSHVLRRRALEPADLEQALETIERNARIQTQLIEDLLDMSRITSGKLRLDIQPVEPVSFIEAALDTVRPAAEAKGIRLQRMLDPAAGPVSGDPNRLQQVVWNLLSNAIKFTPRGGKVQVLLQRVDSHIEISVADTGIGIKPEFLGHVFERFRQADASSTRNYGGLGLGLTIVRHLVELHGGTIGAASAGENRGATFTVQLPLTVVRRPAGEAPRFHPRTPSAAAVDYRSCDLSALRVLVVDDEPDARDLIARVLRDCRAEVLTAAGAGEALRLLDNGKFDLLLSDIGMPVADGYELLRQVRARGETTPAIALTAFARSEDRTRALLSGFLVHVSKPIEPAELVATVASVAGRAGPPLARDRP